MLKGSVMRCVAGGDIIAVSAPRNFPSRAEAVRPFPVSIYCCLFIFIMHAEYCSDAAGRGLRDPSIYG